MHREIWGKDAIKSNSWNGGRSDSSARLLGGLPLLLFGPLTHKDGGGGGGGGAGGLARRQEVFTGSHAHQEAPAIRTARGWGKGGSGMGLEWHQLDFINLRPFVSSCRLQLHSTRLEVFTIAVNIFFIIVIIFMGMWMWMVLELKLGLSWQCCVLSPVLKGN